MPQDIDEHPYAVKTPDFVRFLEAQTEDKPCPACGSIKWIIIGPGDGGTTYLLRTSLRGGSKTSQVTTMALHCEDCGFLRQHVAKVVRDWVNCNPDQSEKDVDQEDIDVNE